MGPLERAKLNLQRIYTSMAETGLVPEALCLKKLTKMDTRNVRIFFPHVVETGPPSLLSNGYQRLFPRG
jgi:hypothetical protein